MKLSIKRRPAFLLASALTLSALAACGGGGNDSPAPPLPAPPPAGPTSIDLRGQVAQSIQVPAGSLSTADVVRLYDASGATRSTNLGADLRFAFTNVGALRAPLLITIESQDMTAVIKSLPAASADVYMSYAGSAVAASALGISTAAIFAAPAASAAQLNTANVDAALGKLRTTLGPVVSVLGADPATFDPAFAMQIPALESILVNFGQTVSGDTRFMNGNAQLPSDRGVNPVLIGTALPPAIFADSEFVKPLLAALTECFKLAVADRATLDASGAITALKAACASMPVASNYSNNLSTFAQRYSDWLLDSRTLNARFGASMFGAASNDAATPAIYMQRSDGFFDSRFDTMRRVAAGGTAWHLGGNQRAYEVFAQTEFQRAIHLNPPPPNATSHFGFSRIGSGIEFRFDPTNGAAAANVRAIRVKGRGLPAAGVVMTRSTSCSRSTRFVFANKTGDASAVNSANRASLFQLQAVAAQSGGALGPWPSTSVDHADAPLTTAQFADFGFLEPYQIEVFKIGDTTTPSEVLVIRTGDKPREAVTARGFGWTQLNQATLDYLNPAGPKAVAAAMMSMGWTLPAPATGQAAWPDPSNAYIATRGTIDGVVNKRVGDSLVFLPGSRTNADFISNRPPPADEPNPCVGSAFPALTNTVGEFRIFGTFTNWNSQRYSNEYYWQTF